MGCGGGSGGINKEKKIRVVWGKKTAVTSKSVCVAFVFRFLLVPRALTLPAFDPCLCGGVAKGGGSIMEKCI
jgi:hypothetical protein